MPFTTPEPSNRRPRVVGDAVVIGKSTVIAHRYVLQGIWEVDKHHPVALSRLLSMAYGKRISSGSDMIKLLENAAAALPRNPREADQIISGLPEPLAEAEARVEEANRLLKDGVSPYRLTEALRGEQLGLSPAPAWTEHLTLCDKGIVLGKGTVIVGLTDDGLDLEGKEGEVLALLSLARRSLAPAEALEKLASVSRAVMTGNISVAAITLAQLGQPPLQDEDLAKSLAFAANRLKRGVKPLELLKKAGFSMLTLEKAYGKSAAWDESLHPRDEKGRFGNGNGGASSGSDTATPAVDGRNLDRSDLTGRYGADASSTTPEKYSLDQQYAANDTGTKTDLAPEAQNDRPASSSTDGKKTLSEKEKALLKEHDAAVDKMNISENEKFALKEITPWEGVLKADGKKDDAAYGGITQDTLDDAKKTIAGLPEHPKGLSMQQLAELQHFYLNKNLSIVGGVSYLDTINGKENVAALVDAIYRHGPEKALDRLKPALERITAHISSEELQNMGYRYPSDGETKSQSEQRILRNFAAVSRRSDLSKKLRIEFMLERYVQGPINHKEKIGGKNISVHEPYRGDRDRYLYFTY